MHIPGERINIKVFVDHGIYKFTHFSGIYSASLFLCANIQLPIGRYRRVSMQLCFCSKIHVCNLRELCCRDPAQITGLSTHVISAHKDGNTDLKKKK